MAQKLAQKDQPITYFDKSVEQTIQILNNQGTGLYSENAKNRLLQNDYNEISEKAKEPILMIFVRQFNNPMVYILFIVVLVSFSLGKILDACVILLVLLTKAILGFIQEYKAEKSVEALKGIVVQSAKVLREGKILQIPARELVVGDVLVLE